MPLVRVLWKYKHFYQLQMSYASYRFLSLPLLDVILRQE